MLEYLLIFIEHLPVPGTMQMPYKYYLQVTL